MNELVRDRFVNARITRFTVFIEKTAFDRRGSLCFKGGEMNRALTVEVSSFSGRSPADSSFSEIAFCIQGVLRKPIKPEFSQ